MSTTTSPQGHTIEISVLIENIYPDEMVLTSYRLTVSAPPADPADLDEWAEDVLYPLTGTGREQGEAAYIVTITSADAPDLVGAAFEYGF